MSTASAARSCGTAPGRTSSTGAIVHEVTAATPVRLRVRIDSLLRPRAAVHGNDGDLVAEWLLPVDVAPGHESPPEPIRYDERSGRHGAIVVRAAGASTVDDGTLTTAAATTHVLTIATATAPSLPG